MQIFKKLPFYFGTILLLKLFEKNKIFPWGNILGNFPFWEIIREKLLFF